MLAKRAVGTQRKAVILALRVNEEDQECKDTRGCGGRSCRKQNKTAPQTKGNRNGHEETQQKMEVVGDVSPHVAALYLGSGQLQANSKAGNMQASKHIK